MEQFYRRSAIASQSLSWLGAEVLWCGNEIWGVQLQLERKKLIGHNLEMWLDTSITYSSRDHAVPNINN
jgi:hypothetical protein